MKELNIDVLKRADWVEYNDGYIMIVDDISKISEDDFKESSVDMIAMLFCIKGSADVVMNDRNLHLSENDVLICTPNTFIDDYKLSADFDCKVIGFSSEAVDSALYISKNVWQNLYYVFQNSVVHIKDSDMKILHYYYYIAEAKLNTHGNVYYKEIMRSLLSCLIYEFLMITDRYVSKDNLSSGADIRQGDILFKRFVELLARERGMIRSVREAADRLNVSSKYLSSVIKNASGKNALEFVHHYTLQEIIRRLKYTDKSIQEISNDMNFPSISFFGKFFKQRMGIAPKQYRKRCAESDE